MEVRWTQRATKDLEAAVEYVAQEDQAAALSLLTHLRSSISNLESFPELGRTLDGTTIREIVVDSYIVGYVLDDERIKILGIVHERQVRPWKGLE